MNFFSLFKRKLIYNFKNKFSIDNDGIDNKKLDFLFHHYGSDKADIFKKNKNIGHGYSKFYEDKLKELKDKNLNILEIGSFAGASAAAFVKYFSNVNVFCFDVNISNFDYISKKIHVFGVDINNEKKVNKNLEKIFKDFHIKNFDIIIDDGSHSSQDIIKTFILYYNHLNNNGLYIVEDLHCSYWKEYSGGLFFPISSISFFKKIVDVINYDHWGIKKSLDWFLKPFSHNYKIDLSHLDFDTINSVEFINSMCVLKKKNNKLGEIVKKGKISEVVPEISNMSSDDFQISKTFQESNTWSNVKILPEDELAILKDKSKNEQ